MDIWQPDVAWCGGLSRALHTTMVATDVGIATFPHGASLGGALALAGVCTASAVPAVEFHLTVEPLRQQIFAEVTRPCDGQFTVRAAPGLAEYVPRDEAAPVLIGGRP